MGGARMLGNYRKIWILTLAVYLLFLFTMMVTAQAADTVKPLPKKLEMDLALSSLPPHLREGATVYTLNPELGFEVARNGTNGFHALVARTSSDVYKGDWPFTKYPDDLLIPIAFDRAGAKENMRPIFDIAKMQAEGVPPTEAKKIISDKYEKDVYKAPERSGISYMLSPVLRAYTNPDRNKDVGTFNFPHYMFYAPDVSNQDIGGSLPPATYPWAFRPGPHGYINLKVGEKEIADINKEFEDMITRLCEFKKEFCLPKKTAQ
jgi:hypothetical protein